MTAAVFERARTDEKLRHQSAPIPPEIGLTVSDEMRMTLTRVAKDAALPFQLKAPDARTSAAMEASEATMEERRAHLANDPDMFDTLGQEAVKP
jgi:DNA-damage-inducible protein J